MTGTLRAARWYRDPLAERIPTFPQPAAASLRARPHAWFATRAQVPAHSLPISCFRVGWRGSRQRLSGPASRLRRYTVRSEPSAVTNSLASKPSLVSTATDAVLADRTTAMSSRTPN